MEELKEKLATLEEAISTIMLQNGTTKAILNGIGIKADENFNKIEGRLSKIEARLNSLSAETSTNFIKVGINSAALKQR